jgi:paraquat-inducible protein A
VLTTSDAVAECPGCGALQTLADLSPPALYECGRCGATLLQSRSRSVVFCATCAAFGLALFAFALALPAAHVWMPGGRQAIGYLPMGPERLRAEGAWELAVAVGLTLFVWPLFKFATVLAMAAGVWLGKTPGLLKRAFGFVARNGEWAMLDVFLLGAMIALFRLRAWMVVAYGPALFALGGAALCSLGIDAALDRAAFWRRVPVPRRAAEGPPGAPLIGCEACGLVARRAEGSRCARCDSRLHARKRASVTRTAALTLTAALLAIPANVLPVLTVTKLGRGGPSTILGGTVELAHAGIWGLAIIVFLASIVVPVVKVAGLSVLLVTTARGSRAHLVLRTRIFRVIAVIGRWSMVDVFATMTLVMLAHFGWLGTVVAEPGAIAFAGVVFVTMLASNAFDPRLMWDRAGMNARPPALGGAS